MIDIREAREEDRESAVRILWKAFESTETFENVLKQNWVQYWHRPENEDWAYVAVDDDRVVANLCFFASEDDVIRGKPVRFGGVWAVATEPHYRRKGLVRKLMDISFKRMKEEGCVLSILDPFYRPFYEQFGYALAEKRAKYEFKKEHIRTGSTYPSITCREATKDDLGSIMKIEKTMARFGSRFFHFKRIVEELIESGHFLIFERNGEPVGTVWFQFSKVKTGPGNNLIVAATRYSNDEVFPSIIEQVRNYSVNVQDIFWYADLDFPIAHYLSSIHSSKTYLLGSMMMRVIDFEGYCKSISIPLDASESVVIQLEDASCPWNEGTYRLSPINGSIAIEKTMEEPEITLDPFQLSSVISGISPASLLRDLREIECSKATADNLTAIFPEDIFVSYTRF